MEVISIDEIEGYMLGDEKTGTLRRIKKVFTSKNMRVHVGIFPPKQASSRHSHPNSEEIVYVVKGRGKVTAGDETREYGPNTLVYIPVGVPHQYFNTGITRWYCSLYTVHQRSYQVSKPQVEIS